MDSRYTLEIREGDKRLSVESMADPFHTTRIRPRGIRAAWAILRGRYSLTVLVGADRETIERVLELDPDYLGPPGSKSRVEWNARVQAELGRISGQARSEHQEGEG